MLNDDLNPNQNTEEKENNASDAPLSDRPPASIPTSNPQNIPRGLQKSRLCIRIWRIHRKRQQRVSPPNIAEKITVFLILVTAFIGAVQARIYFQQKRIMESSGQQTQQLIDAANIQACAANKIAAASIRNADSAKDQADNAKESLRKSGEAFRVSQQPYIAVGRKDGVATEITESPGKDPNQPINITLFLQNAGRLPARTVCVTTHIKIPNLGIDVQPDTDRRLMRELKPNYVGKLHPIESDCPTIGGDSVYNHRIEKSSFTQQILNNFREDLARHPDNSTLEIDALVEYCDQFGTYSCKRVLLDYVRDPISRFRVSHEWDCSSMSNYKDSPEIAMKNRADNATWLYPCITPEEEQKNEQIRQRAAEAERKALQ